MTLLVEVQRCPAVPTAPKTTATMAMFKSAFSVMMMALFPPNSKRLLPMREATEAPTIFPIRVEPVAEIRGTLLSVVSHSPT